MTTTASRKIHLLRVNQRIYRKVSRRDGRRRFLYVVPELKISNNWLRAAGFSFGDRVAVTAEPGMLVVVRVPTRETAAAPMARSPRAAVDALPKNEPMTTSSKGAPQGVS